MKLNENQKRKIRSICKKEGMIDNNIKELFALLDKAKPVADHEKAWKEYEKSGDKWEKPTTIPIEDFKKREEDIIFDDGLVFNNKFLKSVDKKVQGTPESCDYASERVVAEYLLDEEILPGKKDKEKDMEIEEKGIEKVTGYRVDKEELKNLRFSEVREMIRNGQGLIGDIHRLCVYGQVIVYEFEEILARVIGYKYFCIVDRIEKQEKLESLGDIKIDVGPSFLFNNYEHAKKFANTVLGEKQEVCEAISWGPCTLLKNRVCIRLGKDSKEATIKYQGHDIPILGVREKNKKKHVIYYDLNYKRNKRPRVQEIPVWAVAPTDFDNIWLRRLIRKSNNKT